MTDQRFTASADYTEALAMYPGLESHIDAVRWLGMSTYEQLAHVLSIAGLLERFATLQIIGHVVIINDLKLAIRNEVDNKRNGLADAARDRLRVALAAASMVEAPVDSSRADPEVTVSLKDAWALSRTAVPTEVIDRIRTRLRSAKE